MDNSIQYAVLVNKQVVPCSQEQWEAWEPGEDDDFVSEINDVIVETIFTSVNEGTPENPLWFETNVNGGKYDGQQWRYATYDEAAAGHDHISSLVMVAIIEEMVDPKSLPREIYIDFGDITDHD